MRTIALTLVLLLAATAALASDQHAKKPPAPHGSASPAPAPSASASPAQKPGEPAADGEVPAAKGTGEPKRGQPVAAAKGGRVSMAEVAKRIERIVAEHGAARPAAERPKAPARATAKPASRAPGVRLQWERLPVRRGVALTWDADLLATGPTGEPTGVRLSWPAPVQ